MAVVNNNFNLPANEEPISWLETAAIVPWLGLSALVGLAVSQEAIRMGFTDLQVAFIGIVGVELALPITSRVVAWAVDFFANDEILPSVIS